MMSQKNKCILRFPTKKSKNWPGNVLTSAYFTLVRPQLEYAAAIWDPYTQTYKNKIEMVQRRAAWYVCNNYNRETSVTTMIKHLHWRSLQQRKPTSALSCFIRHGIVALDLFPQLIPLVRPSRHRHFEAFQLPVITKQFIQYSFLPHIIANWNNQPANTTTAQFGDFQTEDLQLPTLIDIAFVTLSTFPLLKLQFYTHTIIFSLSSIYFITFSYITLARVHTRRVYKP